MDDEKMVRCMYCGKEMPEINSNNPDDYIHRIVSKFSDSADKDYCCSYCNNITHINRELARMLTEPQRTSLALSNIKRYAEEMLGKEEEIVMYYAERIACHDNRHAFANQELYQDNFVKYIIKEYKKHQGEDTNEC